MHHTVIRTLVTRLQPLIAACESDQRHRLYKIGPCIQKPRCGQATGAGLEANQKLVSLIAHGQAAGLGSQAQFALGHYVALAV